MATATERRGDTPLRNIRVGDLWDEAKAAAARAGTNLSAVARDAYQALVDRETDPVWQDAVRYAQARGTTVDAVQRRSLEQWVARQRAAEERRKAK